MKQLKLRNSLILGIASFIWGVAFVAQSAGGKEIGPYSFTCLRSFIGALVLLPVIVLLDKTRPVSQRPVMVQDKRRLWFAGVSCGIALCLATNLQQLGMNFGATTGKAGFLTALYILLVPILGIFLKKKCPWNVWIGVGIALVGMYFLCFGKEEHFQFADVLLLACALLFSIQILLVDHFAPTVDGVRLAVAEFVTCGVLSAIPMFFFEMKHSLAGISLWIMPFTTLRAWIPLLYAGMLSCGIAYTFQIVGQKGLNPTIASLIMSLESVFSALAGWIILHEVLSVRELCGCGLIFIAIILAQIVNGEKEEVLP